MGLFFKFQLLPRANALGKRQATAAVYGDVATGVRKHATRWKEWAWDIATEHRPAQLSGGECQRIAIVRLW
jgi:predicted ABC-type transport system involved in lysophospholipase L1 biosynthesis ATPase subunit